MFMNRKPDHPINALFIRRFSSRNIVDQPVNQQQLMSLFEAARWAPSSFNNQSWRFVYAHKGSTRWQEFFETIDRGNQAWVKNAAVLMVVISKNTFDKTGKPSRTHSFDTGSAWENLALQGCELGLVVHAIEGFDYDKVRAILNIRAEYTIEAMVIVGQPGEPETELSLRKPVTDFVRENDFTW